MSSLKYRHLGRDSAHRQALLRNLVTTLIERETVSTTLAKAKEVQRLAEKLITLGKKNTNATRAKAQAIFYEPHKHLPKLFGPLRERYLNRPGGYTRLLMCEPLKDDAAPSAVLSLVDGPRDMRFAMTAKALVKQRKEGLPMHELTALNIRKVTRFREGGESALENEVRRLEEEGRRGPKEPEEWENWKNEEPEDEELVAGEVRRLEVKRQMKQAERDGRPRRATRIGREGVRETP